MTSTSSGTSVSSATVAAAASLQDAAVVVVPGATLWTSNDKNDDLSLVVSKNLATGKTRRLCFRNLTQEQLILCWVGTSSPSDLHHFYILEPYQGDDDDVDDDNHKLTTSHGRSDNKRQRQRLLRSSEGGWQRRRRSTPSIRITDQDHVECSFEGHAFVIVAADDVLAVQRNKSLLCTSLNDSGRKGSSKKRQQPLHGEVRRIGAYRADPDTVESEDDNENPDSETRLHLIEIVDTCAHHPTTTRLSHKRSRKTGPATAGQGTNAVPSSRQEHPQETVNPRDCYILSARWVVEESPELLDTYQTKQYKADVLGDCSWPIQLEQHPSWDSSTEDYQRFLQLLASDINAMTQCLPTHAVALLRDESPTPIWVNRTFQYGPKRFPIVAKAMCFHPGHEWLQKCKMHVEKGDCVELYDVEDYGESRVLWGKGGLLVHEFSHAYHYKGCRDGFDNAEIVACYQAAMEQGLYDSVQVKGSQGPTARAYACTNAMEYFAELSTAFLGGVRHSDAHDDSQVDFNKWYPFNRQQIREHDPRAYEMLKKMWKVEDENEGSSS